MAEMRYKNMGRSGLKISALTLGTLWFGRKVDEAAARRIVDRALDAGVNCVDTADIYGKDRWDTPERGPSEEIVGRVLKGRRRSVVLASKVCAMVGPGVNDRLIDVGTGAGFPGIPLKVIYPKLNLTLVESVGKKIDFCQHMVDKLHLENVAVIKDRVEEIGQDDAHRERYDWAVARAVAIMPILVEYLLPLIRVGGQMIAMKGETGPAETHAAESALGKLGGRVKQVQKIELPGVVEERYLITIEKVAATPVRFPRRTGIPKKRPLT